MFEYHDENGEIVITGTDCSEPVLMIPSKLDNKPVTVIAERAFYANKALIKAVLPDTVHTIAPYAFAECRKLETVTMSKTIERIDNYAFYNCHALKAIDLYSHLKNMGYGAFKNCSELKLVNIYADEGQKLVIGALIDDSSNEVALDMHDASGKLLTKLIFTEFEYDCIVQVEARQFDWVYHGSGNVYRECISDNGVDYHKYDGVFNAAVREDWPETAMRIALGRVLYPYKLLNEHRENYIAYLKENKNRAFAWFLKHQDIGALEKCIDFLADKETAEEWLMQARDEGQTEFVSFLMDYKMKHFQTDLNRFEL